MYVKGRWQIYKFFPYISKFFVSDTGMTQPSKFGVIDNLMISRTSPLADIKCGLKTVCIGLTNSGEMFIPNVFNLSLGGSSFLDEFVSIDIVDGLTFVDILIHHRLRKAT